MKKISVIVPCYNAVAYLEQCFSSLEKQTIGITQLEIIFVNDASTDTTGAIIEQYREKYPDSVKTIHLEENRRQGGARNAGIAQATGEYIAFLDADDWMDINAYEVLYQYVKIQNVDIIQFDRINVEGEKSWEENCCVLEGVLALNDIETRKLFLMSGMYSFGCTNKLFARKLINNVNSRFAEQVIFEEPLFVYPLLFFADRVGSVKKHFYYCRHHSESTMKKDAHIRKRICNHPEVQKAVWEWMKKSPWIMREYYAEIEYYFLSTFYAETVCMAGDARGIDADYFAKMQSYVKAECPNWKDNIYFKESETVLTREILQSLSCCFTQEVLDKYCKEIAESVRRAKN